MKSVFFAVMLAISGISLERAFACQQEYVLIGPSGSERTIEESSTTELIAGETYTLRIEYFEDHRNCTAVPEETVFLLDGSRWRVARETQPLVLNEMPVWTRPSSRTNVGQVRFTAATAGTWRVEIIRSCTRDGYSGLLEFTVS